MEITNMYPMPRVQPQWKAIVPLFWECWLSEPSSFDP